MAIGKIKRPIKQSFPSSTEEYIARAENYIPQVNSPFDVETLEKLTLDELAIRYKEIDRQSQLFKGQILLEARRRFPSNIEFGDWRSVNFTELSSSNTGKLINLAKFFQGGRTLEGIPVSAGYLLAAPSNEDIADKVYTEIKNKNLKFDEIKEIIAQNKYIISDNYLNKNNQHDKRSQSDKGIEKFTIQLLGKTFHGKSDDFIEAVLKLALLKLKKRKVNI